MDRHLSLLSPCGKNPVTLKWPDSSENSEQFSDLFIVETIRWVCDDLPELRIKSDLLRKYDKSSYESMRTLCERFNLEIERLQQSQPCVTTKHTNPRPSRGLVQHILRLTYESSITDPKKLNQYKPFSQEVYGETSYEVIANLTEKITITEDDVFLDLGSGVGQVVLQISASTPCKYSIGIERSEIPCSYAKNMDYNFRQWMKWFGKEHGEYYFIKGDFFESQFRDYILTASIIFVNNYAFDPAMDYKLKTLLADMKEGSRIVCSRSLCPQNFRITERNLNDIGCIITVSEMCCFSGAVSWTSKPIPYYIHVINREKLELYFEGLKDPKHRTKKNSTRNKFLSYNSSSKLKDNLNQKNDMNQDHDFACTSCFNSNYDLLHSSWSSQTQLTNMSTSQNSKVRNNLLKSTRKRQLAKTKTTLKLCLNSPAGAKPMVYVWPYVTAIDREESDIVSEIIETIKCVCENIPELENSRKRILRDYDTYSYESMRKLCIRFNEEVEKYTTGQRKSTIPNGLDRQISNDLLMHILKQVYNNSVSDAKQLNQYKPFSSEVYGETSYEVIFEIINKIKLANDDVFLDLGSGVGQVVLQVAATSNCKIVIGIEKAKIPSSYAKSMDINFKKLMNWYGKKYRDYCLIQGDFLDQGHRDMILSATVIFVNNYAFDAVTDHKLREIFSDMRDGTRIISVRSFCPSNFRITQRNLDDVGSIMNVTEISSINNSVSWTCKRVPFYLHEIDRIKLTQFLDKWQPSKNRRKR